MNFVDVTKAKGGGAGATIPFNVGGKCTNSHTNNKLQKEFVPPTYPMASTTSAQSIGMYQRWADYDKTGSGFLDEDEYQAFKKHNIELNHGKDIGIKIPVIHPKDLGDYEDHADVDQIDRMESQQIHRKIHRQNVHALKTATGRVTESVVAPHILGWAENVRDVRGNVKRYEDRVNITGFANHDDVRIHGNGATLA